MLYSLNNKTNENFSKFLKKVSCIPDLMEDYDYASYCAQYRIYQYAILEYSPTLSTEDKKLFYKTIQNLSTYNKEVELTILTNEENNKFEEDILNQYSELNISFVQDLEILKEKVLNHLGFYENHSVIEYEDLKYNQENKKIIYKDKQIKIQGKKSLFVLLFLLRNQKEIVNNETILNAVWEEPENVNINNVELAILNIRKALNIDKDQLIHTYHRHGYLLS